MDARTEQKMAAIAAEAIDFTETYASEMAIAGDDMLAQAEISNRIQMIATEQYSLILTELASTGHDVRDLSERLQVVIDGEGAPQDLLEIGLDIREFVLKGSSNYGE